MVILKLDTNTTDYRGLACEIVIQKWKLPQLKASILLNATSSDANAKIIVDIYKSLNILFENEQQADNWIHQPNKYFSGITALQVMQANQEGMEKVQQYLKAQLY